MTKRLCVVLCGVLGAATVACGGDDQGEPAAPLQFCEGPTALVYDPPSGSLDAFPDDYFTVEDGATPTGLRVKLAPGDNLVLPSNGLGFQKVFAALSTLDGFGTVAGQELVFSGPLDPGTLPASGEGSGAADASVVLVNLDAAEPKFLDFEWELVAEAPGNPQTSLLISPMQPLEPMQRHALVVTHKAKDAQGACISPSPVMRELIEGKAATAELQRLGSRYSDLVAKLSAAGTIDDGGQISAAVVFTTQHTVDDSVTIAQQIRDAGAPAYSPVGSCTDSAAGYLICEGHFEASNYRKEGRFVDDADLNPQSAYTLPVTTYLPTVGAAPFPTLIFGHGLGGDRHQAEALAKFAAKQGFAIVAIDASRHGGHPDAGGKTGLSTVIAFFGLDVANTADPLDALALRDNWRQSTYDKLQLLELLRPGVDVDGDGTKDVGTERLGYHGVSLGGIMAAEFLSLAPEVKVSIAGVPGARVVNIIKDAPQFSMVISLLSGQATNGQKARFFPVVQTAVDRGDAGSYTRHVVRSRLPGFDTATPQMLMQMVLQDDTVPNSTNKVFARGLGVPLVGDELLVLGGVAREPTLPVSGNIDAEHTAGIFEFDVVLSADGVSTEQATHSNVHDNPVGVAQSLRFFRSYFDQGISEIIDPYRTLGIK